ncbi:hypothetical protein I4U23_014899 [Adineta vaga]|nr:hypothetical protein I4U23_014899 [Adineta vaga]
MPGKQDSDQSSTTSHSSVSKKSPPKSLIVSNVSVTKNENWLFNHLNNHYVDVKKVFRNHDQDGNELNSIRIDFYFDKPVLDILQEGRIYIEDKPHYIRPFWPTVCYQCRSEGHISAQCPQQPISEVRLFDLLEKQKTDFESMINDFEHRWNERIFNLKPSNNTDMSQLLPIVNDIASVCQQMNQHGIQMQKQLSTIVTRVQNLQNTSN